LDILDASMGELIEPVATGGLARKRAAARGTDAGIGELRPRRARITPAGK